MYALKLAKLLSSCNRSLLFTRKLVSSHPLNSLNVLTAVNFHRNELIWKGDYLFNVSSFSTSSSPDDNHNVSTGKVKKKRLRIISDSSSDENSLEKQDIEK